MLTSVHSPELLWPSESRHDDAALRAALAAAHTQNARLRESLSAMRFAMEALPHSHVAPAESSSSLSTSRTVSPLRRTSAQPPATAEAQSRASPSLASDTRDVADALEASSMKTSAGKLQSAQEEAAAPKLERGRLTNRPALEDPVAISNAQQPPPQPAASASASPEPQPAVGGSTDDSGHSAERQQAAERIAQLQDENEKLMELNSALRAEHDDLLTRVAWGGAASTGHAGLQPPPPEGMGAVPASLLRHAGGHFQPHARSAGPVNSAPHSASAIGPSLGMFGAEQLAPQLWHYEAQVAGPVSHLTRWPHGAPLTPL
jgi:hypothetical protein